MNLQNMDFQRVLLLVSTAAQKMYNTEAAIVSPLQCDSFLFSSIGTLFLILVILK